jgi:conjugal transfer ATP-binding protein TraC
MISCIKKALTGESGGLQRSELEIKRHQFSSMFPYVGYDPESKSYYLQDNSVGYIWECSTVLFADDNIFNQISSVLKSAETTDTVLQFMLFADPFVNNVADAYRNLRNDNHNILPIHRKSVDDYADFIKKHGKKGMWQLSGTPLRHFRLFISVRIPIKIDIVTNPAKFVRERDTHKDFISNVKESFKIFAPENVEPDNLITTLFRLVNPDLDHDKLIRWDDRKPIHKQIVYSDTQIERKKTSIRFNDRHIGIITPKKLPREIDNIFANDLIGYISKGAAASENDISQIQCPFIYTVNIVINKHLKSRLQTKAVQNSKATESASKDARHFEALNAGTNNRKHENMYVAQRYESGEKFVHVIPQLMLIADSEDELTGRINRTKSIWSTCGIESQTERDYLLHVLFISALPCGLYPANYPDLDRDYIMDTQAAAMFTPVQASFSGIGAPVLLYIDRRGEVVFLDIFKTGKNKNAYVTGGTGAGKSFFMNGFVNSYMSVGAKFRIITVCDSYRKACYMTEGQYIEHEEHGMVLNFFEEAGVIRGSLQVSLHIDEKTYPEGTIAEVLQIENGQAKLLLNETDIITVPETDIGSLCIELDGDTLLMLTGILASMLTSRAGEKLNEDELTILETAIEYVFSVNARKTRIDDIYDYLMNISQHHSKDERSRYHIDTAYKLALRLKKYCTGGQYGHFFNGRSTVKFSSDLVVADLTKTPEDLRKVIVLAFANIIEQEIYKGDRKTPQFVVLDESWQTLSENPYAAKFVEGLYRKARKYNAAVIIITQSLHDLSEKGKLQYLGNVIRTQSEFSFNLYDENFGFAFKNELLNISEFEYQMLINKIPKNSLPRYSEIYVQTPAGNTVVRFIVDETGYFINTSDPADYVYIKTIADGQISKGMSRNEAMQTAIEHCVRLAKELGGIGEFKKQLAGGRLK